MPSPSLPALGLLVLVPLVAWRMYARFRRLVGRQRLSRVRPWVSLILFPLLVVLVGVAARGSTQALVALAGALAGGALLGAYGLSKTHFETTKRAFYYTPHAPLGIALWLLFAGRIAYRLFEIAMLAPGALPAHAASPLTAGIFGLLAGYYVAYALGLLRWRLGQARRREE